MVGSYIRHEGGDGNGRVDLDGGEVIDTFLGAELGLGVTVDGHESDDSLHLEGLALVVFAEGSGLVVAGGIEMNDQHVLVGAGLDDLVAPGPLDEGGHVGVHSGVQGAGEGVAYCEGEEEGLEGESVHPDLDMINTCNSTFRGWPSPTKLNLSS